MQKIPSLYMRDPEDIAHVTRNVSSRCEWVFNDVDSCKATVKFDGTCVMMDVHEQWWARHQLRSGKSTPDYYIPVEHDPVTGKTQGWIPIGQSGFRKFHEEAVERVLGYGHPETLQGFTSGTYELIGPRIGRNPHQSSTHMLIRHGSVSLADAPTDYDLLKTYLLEVEEEIGYLEGIVWHHADGRMAKIKTRDFA
jgi:hypothetical protein